MAFQYEAPVSVYNGPDADYWVNAQLNTDGSFTQLVGLDDGWSDAFGRLRVSNPETLFESSFSYDTQPLLFEPVVSNGTVTHDGDSRSATLAIDTSPDASAVLQSRSYIPYEKGKSQLVKITFTLGAAVANVTRRVGYFDAANGFFLEQSDAGLSLVRRSSTSGSVVNTSVAQASWNIDPLDGTGPSGITLDPERAQILVIDGQWLGVGRVRVGFNIDGAAIYVHEFLHANRAVVAPYTQTFTLPIRWEVSASGASAGASFQAICCEVESEGGVSSPNGFTFSAANTADVNTSTTRVALLSIRPATEYPAGSGYVNRTYVIPGDISLLVQSQPCTIEVFYGSTLTGGTWTRVNANSAVEYGVGQTITTPGVPVDSFFAAAGASAKVRAALGGSIDSQYPLALSVAGDAPKALTIAATTIANNGTARAAIGWKEIR